MSKKIEIPEYNKYDNIWQIKKEHPEPIENIKAYMEGKTKHGLRITFFKGGSRVKNTYKVRHAPYFIHLVWRIAKKLGIELPIWKAVCPDLDRPDQGSIYYIVHYRTKKGKDRALMFRGTYGYWGTGPHESALIEQFFEHLKWPIEVRGPDYLLDLIR